MGKSSGQVFSVVRDYTNVIHTHPRSRFSGTLDRGVGDFCSQCCVGQGAGLRVFWASVAGGMDGFCKFVKWRFEGGVWALRYLIREGVHGSRI